MDKVMARLRGVDAGTVIRRLITAWLAAAAVEYIALPKEARGLDGLLWLGHILFLRLILVAAIAFALLTLLYSFVDAKNMRNAAEGKAPLIETGKLERAVMAGMFAFLAIFSLFFSFSVSFAVICVLIAGAFFVYAEFGADTSDAVREKAPRGGRVFPIAVFALAAVFVILDSVWTICRIRGFSTPTFDFGIFSQMFYYMKETGIPYTTVERDGLLSHFAVHVSPIYYLMLPIYMIFPYPETIQVLQAVVIASAVIPLFMLGRLHGLSDTQRTLVCAVFLIYPALSGGTSYDIHENCFLAPLVLWLLYGIDKKSVPVISVSLMLTLFVKEDAAVYAAVVALYVIVRAIVNKNDRRRELVIGFSILAVSLLWFAFVSVYLTKYGDGTLASDRYPNFIDGDTSPLVTIVKTAIICPMKLVFECVDAEKLTFLAQTMLPLLAMPLFTRRYERYILLLPYLIVNLVSDYQYLHDIFFQYVFGTSACLFYLVVVNLADIKTDRYRMASILAAGAVTATFFGSYVVPKAYTYTTRATDNAAYYDGLRETLDIIPDDASVTATTFCTTYLSQRRDLYDVRYSSKEHLLSCDYVVVDFTDSSSLNKYGGEIRFRAMLTDAGFEKCGSYGSSIELFKKADN